jgi:nitrate/nitrite transporter NarK
MGLVTPAWPFAAVVAVALALAGTAVSWHGINLSEIARLAPSGMVGAVTGGIIAFGSVSGILFPVGMSALLAATGNYALCFWIAAVAPLLVGFLLLRRRAAPQIPQSGPA